jgi:hypothetical protein
VEAALRAGSASGGAKMPLIFPTKQKRRFAGQDANYPVVRNYWISLP